MITFSIDTLPMSKCVIDSNDYSSKIIYSSVCDTLFKYNLEKNLIVKNACEHYEYSKNKKILIIKIRDDLYFNNGIKVTSNDYYKIFRKILNSKTHIGMIFKRFFTKIEIIDQYTLKLTNKTKNDRSHEILSIYSTGCLDEKYSSGAYFIKEIGENYIYLERNKFYRKKVKNKEAEQIKFVITDGLNDYKLFNNKIQITNNTIADVNNIDKYNYLTEKNYIYLSILFSNNYMDKKYKRIRKIIFDSINCVKISNKLNSKHKKYQSFIINDNNLKEHKMKKNMNKKNKISLSIGYNNFYPNKIIAEEIKEQLEESCFNIKLVENNFSTLNNCDLNIVLNYIEYISESALINGTFLAMILEKNFIYNFLLKMYNMKHKKYLLKIINKKLLRLKYKIPILQMQGYYLKDEKYNNFNYIELNFDEL